MARSLIVKWKLSRKQQPGETIEQYAQSLNNLADSCEYKSCCRSRYLRDIFVAGLNSTKIISALLHHECDKMEFNAVVKKAKMLHTFSNDVENIKQEDRCHVMQKEETRSRSKAVPRNYVCIRCGAKEKHYANECFALKLKCNKCSRIGPLARCCKSKKNVNALTDAQFMNIDNGNGGTASSTHTGAPFLTGRYASRPETYMRIPPAVSGNQEEAPFGSSTTSNQKRDFPPRPQEGGTSIYGLKSADLHTPSDAYGTRFECEDKFNDFLA